MKIEMTVIVAAAISLATPAGLAAGNAAAGGTKFEACLGCHAVPNYSNVYPQYRVPKLAGQRPEYVVEALKSYQSGQRAHATMRANATTLTEQDMEDIAAFLIATQ